jgi:hypothetical protein
LTRGADESVVIGLFCTIYDGTGVEDASCVAAEDELVDLVAQLARELEKQGGGGVVLFTLAKELEGPHELLTSSASQLLWWAV